MRILEVAFLLLFNYLDSLPKLYSEIDIILAICKKLNGKFIGFVEV